MTRSERLQELNESTRKMISGAFVIISSIDSVDEIKLHELKYTVELLNSIAHTASLSDHRPTLKKEYVFRLLCNLRPKNGHVSGF